MYVASRELRNATGGLLKRVQAGEEVVITVRGVPVAQLVPVRSKVRRPLTREEFIRRLPRIQADPGLRDDLAALGGTLEDLGPLEW
jgi:prevent-host-death family protein